MEQITAVATTWYESGDTVETRGSVATLTSSTGLLPEERYKVEKVEPNEFDEHTIFTREMAELFKRIGYNVHIGQSTNLGGVVHCVSQLLKIKGVPIKVDASYFEKVTTSDS